MKLANAAVESPHLHLFNLIEKINAMIESTRECADIFLEAPAEEYDSDIIDELRGLVWAATAAEDALRSYLIIPAGKLFPPCWHSPDDDDSAVDQSGIDTEIDSDEARVVKLR
jgi:hypothetical protein